MKLHDRLYVAWAFLFVILPSPVMAQIIPDDTLGTESSQISPNVEIRGGRGDRIEGGAIRGANLFHSFQEFNVNAGQRVYFANPAGVQNILSRVTGRNASNIQGTLGVEGGANLFLLNPNGIVFGQNARLDINGSFVGNTANGFRFADGSEFSAIDPQAAPLLTVNVPIGLQYGASSGGSIISTGNLSVGQDLLLSADTLVLQGQLHAGRDLILRSPHPIQAQAVQWSSGRDFSMGDYRGGSLQVNAGRNIAYGTVVVDAIALPVNPTQPAMLLRSGGQIAGTGNISTTVPSGGLQVDFLSQGDMNIRGITTQGGAINLTSLNGGITTNGVTLDTTNGAKDGGAIALRANGNIAVGDLDSFSFAPYNVTNDGYIYKLSVSGNGGVISILTGNGNISTRNLNTYSEASNFSLTDQSFSGNGGSISIFTGNGNISTRNLNSYSRSRNAGNGGAITASAISGIIIANDLNSWSSDSTSYPQPYPRSLALIPTFTRNGGAITLSASNGITARDIRASSYILTESSPSTGNGGSIIMYTSEGNIVANYLTAFSVAIVDNKSCIRGCPISAGNGGDIRLAAPNGNITIRSSIETGVTAARSGENSYRNILTGDSGDVIISAYGDIYLGLPIITTGSRNAGSVSIITTNGSIITTGSFYGIYAFASRGIGGAVTFSAPNGSIVIPSVNSTFAFSGILTLGNRNSGGDITLTSRNNILLPSLNTTGNRHSGNITVTTDGDLSVLGNSVITTDNFGSGRSGNITLRGRSIAITNGSQLSASTHGRGQAGNITLSAFDSIQLSGIAPDNKPPILFTEQGGLVGIPVGTYIGGYLPTGDARNLNTDDRSTIFPSGVFTQTTRGSSGNSGNIDIQTDRLIVRDGAAIGISTFGTGSSGNLTVRANSVLLDNGTVTASTVSQGGGNITFNDVNLLEMRNNSLISAEALNNANGGNITINANNGFIIASPTENNDIIARAAAGRGGNITIPALGILGLEEQSARIGNYTSDIDATGQTPGTVTINGLSTDPSRGLAALPTDITDRSNQISQNCAPQAGESSQFVATGRGGLPLSPDQPLHDRTVLTPEWVMLDATESEARPQSSEKTLPDSTPVSANAIVEANSWTVDANGKVALIDQPLAPIQQQGDRVCLERSQ